MSRNRLDQGGYGRNEGANALPYAGNRPNYQDYGANPYAENYPQGNPYAQAPAGGRDNGYSGTGAGTGAGAGRYEQRGYARDDERTQRAYGREDRGAYDRPAGYDRASPVDQGYNRRGPGGPAVPAAAVAGGTGPHGAPQGGSNAYGAPAGGANAYEMSAMRADGGGRDDMGTFLQEVEDLRSAVSHFDENISRIENLHQRSLNEISEEQSGQTQRQLDAMTAETSQLMNNLKNRIKSLQSRSRDNARRSQSEALTNKFKQAVQRYQVMEANYRQKYKEQMGRQYRIVRPDATEDEVHAAVDDSQGGQVFSQALLQSNRRGEARSALKEVQARHQDIQKIERTMGELAQLFQEMAVMVEQQDPVVAQIHEQSEQTQEQLSKGVQETDHAVKSARAARRKKWICLGIVILILIVVGLVVGLVVGIKKP